MANCEEPRVDRTKMQATTDEDIARHVVEHGEDPVGPAAVPAEASQPKSAEPLDADDPSDQQNIS